MSVMSHAARLSDHRRIRAFLLEFGLISAVFLMYRSGRMFTRDATDQAFENAGDVIQFERTLGIFTESGVQDWVLGTRAVVEFLNHYYVMVHFPITICFLLWAYVRHPNAYRVVRTWFVLVTLVALVIHVGYPLAPPRMTAGFVDTLHEFGPRIYPRDTHRSVSNQFAAMPSLHFGWAFMLAIGFVAIKRTGRSLVVFLHPVLTLLAIVATGNHYWLDAIVAAVLAVGVGIAMVWPQLRADAAERRYIAAIERAPGVPLAVVDGEVPHGDDHRCPLATHTRDRCRHHSHERHDRADAEVNAPAMAVASAQSEHPPGRAPD